MKILFFTEWEFLFFYRTTHHNHSLNNTPVGECLKRWDMFFPKNNCFQILKLIQPSFHRDVTSVKKKPSVLNKLPNVVPSNGEIIKVWLLKTKSGPDLEINVV